jgi:hypothetical protein
MAAFPSWDSYAISTSGCRSAIASHVRIAKDWIASSLSSLRKRFAFVEGNDG